MIKPKPQLWDDERRGQVMAMLPATISSVEVQKKDSNRFSLFVDGAFLLGLPIPLVEKLGLRKGSVLNKPLVGLIESEVMRDGIRSWLLHLLGKRSYSYKQLLSKSIQSAYDKQVVESILHEFIERGWVDDEAFARAFVRDKSRFQKWGPNKIRQHLQQTGVNSTITDAVMKAEINKEDQQDMLVELVMKRSAHFLREPDQNKRKKKIIDYLLRKGFDFGSIFSKLETVIKQLES